MSVSNDQFAPKQPLLELVKQHKKVLAAIFLAGVVAFSIVQYMAAKPMDSGEDGNAVTGICGPPACPAHLMKNPTTGLCTIAC